MKLVTYRTDAHGRAGILVDEAILDLASCFAWYEHREGRPCGDGDVEHKYGHGVHGFVQHAELARPAADEILIAFTTDTLPKSFDGRILAIQAKGKHLLAPLPRPPSLRRGAGEFANHQAVVGPGDVFVEALHTEKLDFDFEAAVVVGKESKNLTAEQADNVIFGLTIMNGFVARGLAATFATSLGPWLVTIDELAAHVKKGEIGAQFDLAMTARVNGNEVAKGNLREMPRSFGHLLGRASYGVTLFAGDVIGSGPCAVKVGGEPWLRPEDIVELEIDGLGVLRNRVVLAS